MGSLTQAAHSAERTFRFFTSDQSANYAQHRQRYHPQLFKFILNHHIATGGQLDTVLDVGCGPGNAVRDLAPTFAHAIGLDSSAGMIGVARDLGGVSSSSLPIRFEISSAEDLGTHLTPSIPDSSVDLITAANAAHWFDMEHFWPRAAQVLKPGGTAALWARTAFQAHPSMPNYEAIQAALQEFEDHLKPYLKPGNIHKRSLYIDLSLPWTLPERVLEFDEGTFCRKAWNNKNVVADDGDQSFADHLIMDLDTLERVWSTISPVTRWREAHPDAVGTENDVVSMLRKTIEQLLHEAGVEKGKEIVQGITGWVILIIKRAG